MVPGWFNYLLLSLTRGRYSGPIAQSQGSDISHGFVPGHGRENWVNETAWGLSTISHGGAHQIERIWLWVDMCTLECFVVSNSLWPFGLQAIRLLCPWDFLGKNTEVGCHFILQGIFPTQGRNPCLQHLAHWEAGSLRLSHLGSLELSCDSTIPFLIDT